MKTLVCETKEGNTMKNLLKEKITNNEHTIGVFQVLGDASIAEIIGYAGFDYVLIDTEHGPFEIQAAQEYIRAAKLAGTTPLARVKDSSRNSILKMLDVGAQGLVIPHLHKVDEIKQVVEYGKYYLIGDRGFGATSGNTFLTADYTKQGMLELFKIHNQETLIIPQCETKESLENIEEIVKVDGVDGIFIGPYDLSVSLGVPGEVEGPVIKAAIQRVVAAAQAAGKFTISYTDRVPAISDIYEMGVDSVTYSSDASILSRTLTDLIQQIKK